MGGTVHIVKLHNEENRHALQNFPLRENSPTLGMSGTVHIVKSWQQHLLFGEPDLGKLFEKSFPKPLQKLSI